MTTEIVIGLFVVDMKPIINLEGVGGSGGCGG